MKEIPALRPLCDHGQMAGIDQAGWHLVKLKTIGIYQTELPYVGGTYRWGAGNAITVAQATVVVIGTDSSKVKGL